MSDARAAVEAELLAWMRDEPESEDEARFARLALETFRYQAERCPALRPLLRRPGHPPRERRRLA